MAKGGDFFFERSSHFCVRWWGVGVGQKTQLAPVV